MKTKKQKGFTLIELLIVVAIIGLLATIVLVAVSRARKKAVATQMKAHAIEAMKAVELAATDGCTSLTLTSGAAATGAAACGSNVYIQRVPVAPTGADYSGLYGAKNVSNYTITVTGFSAGNFTCTNGSCYCTDTTSSGCTSIN